jgi:hypothetical protein
MTFALHNPAGLAVFVRQMGIDYRTTFIFGQTYQNTI